jgi:hypothetical protein
VAIAPEPFCLGLTLALLVMGRDAGVGSNSKFAINDQEGAVPLSISRPEIKHKLTD